MSTETQLDHPPTTLSSFQKESKKQQKTTPREFLRNVGISEFVSYSNMSTARSTSTSTPEKDTMSITSSSTMTSTKSLLRSLLPSKRDSKATKTEAAKSKATETPAEKAERKLTKAEALHDWALHR
ncbi:hypothetical protein BM1_02239 [Bipolaris maydis]|nr:hypothetical protein BM1_02239 [Bipolaris maydis]